MNEKLTKIESVIRELNPELQELTFGCEVEYRSFAENDVNGHITWRCKDIIGIDGQGWDVRRVTKIIGHPIHIQHILRALYEKGLGIRMDTGGWVYSSLDGTYKCTFDLSKPLHSQSDDFISWLYGVLCE